MFLIDLSLTRSVASPAVLVDPQRFSDLLYHFVPPSLTALAVAKVPRPDFSESNWLAWFHLACDCLHIYHEATGESNLRLIDDCFEFVTTENNFVGRKVPSWWLHHILDELLSFPSSFSSPFLPQLMKKINLMLTHLPLSV